MKVIDSLWFTNMNGTVGIVTIEEDVTGERKAYISAVPIVIDEKRDTEAIIAWGNKFSIGTAERILLFLKKEDKEEEAKREATTRDDTPINTDNPLVAVTMCFRDGAVLRQGFKTPVPQAKAMASLGHFLAETGAELNIEPL